MTAKVKFTDGLQFVGEAPSGHAIVMDAGPEVGGSDTGVRPTELVLLGLGGCTGMDVVSILKKKRQPLRGLEVVITGQKAESHPRKFTDIEVEFIVKGKGISEDAVKRAIELSWEKYCSVKATLEGTARVGYRYRMVEE